MRLFGTKDLRPRTMRAYCKHCEAMRTFHFDTSALGYRSGWRCAGCGGGLPGMVSLLVGRRKG